MPYVGSWIWSGGLRHLYFIMTTYGGKFCCSIKAMASTLSKSPISNGIYFINKSYGLSLVTICNAIVAVCGPLILTWFYCCCVIFACRVIWYCQILGCLRSEYIMLLSMVIIACLVFCIRKTIDNFMASLPNDILSQLSFLVSIGICSWMHRH